jgi:sugar phosphate permease
MASSNDSSKRSTKNLTNIFFGWWTVIATGIMAGWGSGVWSYGFGSYFKPIQDQFGWSRAQLSAAHSLGRLEGGVEGPFGGFLTDKYGPRVVNLIGEFMAGLGLILMYFMNSFWQFLFFWGFLVSVGFNLAGFGPLETALSNWFIKRRGLAIGLGRFIFGVMIGVILPMMSFLLYQYGWQIAFLIAGFMTWIIGIPLTWFFVKPKRPEYYGLLPDGVKQLQSDNLDISANNDTESLIDAGIEYARQHGEIEFSVRQMIWTRVFWIMAIASILYQVSWSVVQLHHVPHLIDVGIDPVVAAGALGMMVLVSAPGRLLGGVMMDRIPSDKIRYVFFAVNTAQVLELFIFLFAKTINVVYVFVVLYGFTMGIRYVLYPLTRGRFFGRKAYGSIQGISSLISLPASIISPIYAGWIYDVTGSYSSVLVQGIGLLAFASIAFLFMTPPKPPEQITGVTDFL